MRAVVEKQKSTIGWELQSYCSDGVAIWSNCLESRAVAEEWRFVSKSLAAL